MENIHSYLYKEVTMTIIKTLNKYITLLLVLLFLLAACSRTTNIDNDYNEVYEQGTSVGAENETDLNADENHGYDANEPVISADILREQIRPYLLSDFDYLVSELEDNMPLFGVIYRRLGVDLRDEFANVRESIATSNSFGTNAENIEQMRRSAADFLHANLRIATGRLQGLGHIGPLHSSMYAAILINHMTALADEECDNIIGYLNNIYSVFKDPLVMWFYQLEEDDIDFNQEGFFSTGNDPSGVHTGIVSPGEIAHISIRHAMNDVDYDRAVLLSFFEEIQGFNHLIIDLRGHRGGNGAHFTETVIKPLLSAPIQVSNWEFFTNGESTQRHIETSLALSAASSGGIFTDFEFTRYNAADFADSRDMTYFLPQDLAGLTYAIESSAFLIPMDDGYPFHGKIWILTDSRSASAAELAVIYAKSSGFATVVGEPTAGVMPASTHFVMLPNTGILFRMDIGYFTDDYGRSMEEFGIAPDYPSRPRLDARQTVLEMIAEGDW